MDSQTAKQRQMPLLKNKPILYLLAAQAVSNLGDWLDLLALFTLAVFKWQATPAEMATASLCLAVPMVVFGPVAGVLADQMERKTLMIVSDAARAFLVLSLVWVDAMWQVYVILIAKALFEAVFTPAKNGKIKEIVPAEQIQQVTTLTTIIDQLAKIVGPILGGVLVGMVGTYAAFYIDTVSFVLSALLLLGIPARKIALGQERGEKRSFLQECKEGLQFVCSIPLLLFGMLLFFLVMLVLQMADSQIMILFREIKQVSTNFIGAAMAASGIGLMISAGALSRMKGKSTLGLMALGTVGIGLAYAAAAFVTEQQMYPELIIPLAFLLGGASAGLVFLPFQTEGQRRTPVELSGRVFGTINSVITAAVIAGPFVGAVTVTALGVVPAFLIAGGLLVVIGLVSMTVKKQIERRDQHVAESNAGAQGTAST